MLVACGASRPVGPSAPAATVPDVPVDAAAIARQNAEAEKENPLRGATELALGDHLCGIVGHVVRCIGTGPFVETTFSARPVHLLVDERHSGQLRYGCVLTERGSVECWDRRLEYAFRNAGDPPLAAHVVKALEGSRAIWLRASGWSLGVCGQSQGADLSCVRLTRIEAPTPWDLGGSDSGNPVRTLRNATIVDDCVVGAGPQPQLLCDDADMASAARKKLADGWVRWVGGGATFPRKGTIVSEPYALGIDAEGVLHGTGTNFFGQLGNGRMRDGEDASTLAGLGRVTSFAVAGNHACAVVGGRVACWGEATSGEVPNANASTIVACPIDTRRTQARWESHIRELTARVQSPEYRRAEEASIRECEAAHQLDCRLGGHTVVPDPKSPPPPELNVYRREGDCVESPRPLQSKVVASPTFVAGIDDATQVVVDRQVSCATRRSGQPICWGKPFNFRVAPNGIPY